MLLSSCARTAEPEDIGDGYVTFSAELAAEATATADDATGSKAATKAAQITSINKFSVTAWNNGDTDKTAFISGYTDVNVSWSGSAGTASMDKRWTKPYAKVFYACANLPGTGATVSSTAVTGQTLTYSTVPEDAANQNDILMGTYSGEGSNPSATTRTAALKFKHALTSVVFTVGNLANVKSVDKISIDGVYVSGSVTQGPDGTFGSWSGMSSTQTVIQTVGGTLPAANAVIGVPFIIIPQTNAQGLAVEIEMTLNDNTTMTCTGTLGKNGGVSWLAGKNNTYKISVSNLNTLKFSYTVTPWGSENSIPADLED